MVGFLGIGRRRTSNPKSGGLLRHDERSFVLPRLPLVDEFETGLGQAVFQFSDGEELDQGKEAQESSNRRNHPEDHRHVAETRRTGNKGSTWLEHLVNSADHLCLVFQEVQDVVAQNGIQGSIGRTEFIHGGAFESDGRYHNKQRCLTLCSRGVTSRFRHLLEDLRTLMPHHKKESKLDADKGAKGGIGHDQGAA